MAIEPIKGFYVHDESADIDGVAKYDYKALENIPDIVELKYQLVNVKELDNITVLNGYYGNLGDSGTIYLASNTTSYNSVVYYPQQDINIYIDSATLSSLGYVSVCVVEDAGELTPREGVNAYYIFGKAGTFARYRKSDNNMPTANSPLFVKAGSAIVFSETATANNWQYYFDTSFKLTELVSLGNAQIEQVKGEITDVVDTRKCKVRYINGTGLDASIERLEIFIPTVVGYVGYSFLHGYHLETDVSWGHQNIWRVGYAYAFDNNLIQRYAITTSGEWEVALHLPNRDDFSGGHVHGDEIFTDIVVLLDGLPIDYTTITELTEFDTLTIVEQSNLYDPADHETVIAKHGSEHIFNSRGLVISQSVKWLVSTGTEACYMAMFPIAQSVSDYVYVNSDYEVSELPQRVSRSNAAKAVLYSDDLGLKAEFSTSKQPFDVGFLCTDNGGTQYNKCYYTIPTGQTVSVNDRWESVTEYNIVVSE